MQKSIKVTSNKTDKSILLSLQKPYFSLIWLHGLGDTSEGFLQFFQQPYSPVYKGARVKLINAPIRPVTINGGMKSTSWYDIKDLSGKKQEKERFNYDEVNESLSIIDKHVIEEINYWKQNGFENLEDSSICQRIFVGGFSQGCAMSLCYGLNADRLIGGIIGYSGHLFEIFPMKNREKIPLLVYHGDRDTVLNFKWVKPQYEKHLKPLTNFKFTLLQGLSHTVTDQQLKESGEWIHELLKKRGIEK